MWGIYYILSYFNLSNIHKYVDIGVKIDADVYLSRR